MVYRLWCSLWSSVPVADNLMHTVQGRYELHLLQLYEPLQFKQAIRMSKRNFDTLAHSLEEHMTKQYTNARKPINAHKRIAMALYQYAHGGTYEKAGEKFGFSGPIAHRIMTDFLHAVILVHSDQIYLPTAGPELLRIIKGFESRRQMPNCFGAIDCSHFMITAPKVVNRRGYYDKSGKMSVTMQAVVDSLQPASEDSARR